MSMSLVVTINEGSASFEEVGLREDVCEVAGRMRANVGYEWVF